MTVSPNLLFPTSLAPAHLTTTLAHVSRSGELESAHRGCIAVSDAEGRLIAHAGDPGLPVFWRSAAKLHQAIPLIMEGGIHRWQLSDAQLAIICGSHNGEPEQVACVSSILNTLGLAPDALHCGSQEPYGKDAAKALIRGHEEPSSLHNTCSGNHAGLLALSQLLGVAPPDDYEALEHPAQQRALAAVARFSGLDPAEIFTGIDGCGIPAYRTPLRNLALAFARLLAIPPDWDVKWQRAVSPIVHAVTTHPEFVSGKGELDTECLRAFEGAAVCKLGAEAVCAAAFERTSRFPNGVGIAIKIEDGLGNRARAVVLAECFAQLGLGTHAQRDAFNQHIERTVKTRRGEIVGEVCPAFQLEFSSHDSWPNEES